jgi:tetratricopeptide (TPR) repeat protein
MVLVSCPRLASAARTAVFILVTALSWLLAGSASAQQAAPPTESDDGASSTPKGDSAPERALKLHDQARGLYTQGRYSDAVAKLLEAVRLDPKAIVLYYNLGLIEEKTGDLRAAQEHYEAALALETDERERDKLRRIIRRVEAAQSHGEGRAPTAAPSTPAPSDSGDDQPQAPEHGAGLAPFAWGAAGLAAAGLVVGVALALRADATDPGRDPTTSAEVSLAQLEADADKAHDLAVGADIAFAVASVATVAAIVLGVVETTSGGDTAMLPRLESEGLTWRF